MSDYSELKKLAEAATPGPWAYDGSYVCPARTEDGTTYVELWRSIADCHQPENTKFIAAANPAVVLALIAEVEGLRAQHGRDSAELRSLCQARDYARKERDQLKEEIEALRKDKDRLDALEANFWDVRHTSTQVGMEGDTSQSIEIVGSWMDAPRERVIGENYSENLRAAIDQAMKAPAYPPARPEYEIPDFEPGSGNKARRRAEALGIDYESTMRKEAKP